MNRHSINAATINAILSTGGQRAIVNSVVYARAAITARVGGRSPVISKPKAVSTISMRAWARGVVSSTARAVFIVTGLNRNRAKVGINASAKISIAGGIAPRGYENQPVVLRPSAIVWMTGRAKSRSPLVSSPEARITFASPKSYARFHVAINVTGKAVIRISPELRKQIPYDADAPEERTIFIPGVNRLMVV